MRCATVCSRGQSARTCGQSSPQSGFGTSSVAVEGSAGMMASLWSSPPPPRLRLAAAGRPQAGRRAGQPCSSAPRHALVLPLWSCHGERWARPAAVPPEPAEPPGRRRSGGRRHRAAPGRPATRCCAPGTSARADGRRLRVGDAVPARVGGNGFVRAAERRQGTGTSPAGHVRAGLGVRQRAGPGDGAAVPGGRPVNDWWAYDPRDPGTYNVLQPRRVAASALAPVVGRGPVGLRRAVPLRRRCSTSTCRPA